MQGENLTLWHLTGLPACILAVIHVFVKEQNLYWTCVADNDIVILLFRLTGFLKVKAEHKLFDKDPRYLL